MNRQVLFRIAAVLLGLAAVFLAAETVLRIAAGIVESTRRNEAPTIVHERVRILCVGESTTVGLWPDQLQEILNREGGGPVFSVIKRGGIGIVTDNVANQIETWLDQVRPQVVVTMLGINDEGNVLVYRRGGARPWLVDNLKAVRLSVLLWRSVFNVGLPEDRDEEPPGLDSHLDNQTRSTLEQLLERRLEAEQDYRFTEIIGIQREILGVDPGTPFFHLTHLRKLVLEHHNPQEVDEFFSRQIGEPSQEMAIEDRYLEIAGWSERTGNRFAGLRLAASIAYGTHDVVAEYEILMKAVDDPGLAGLAWIRLAELAFRRGRTDELRHFLLRADLALPDNYGWSLLLGDVCFLLEAYDLSVEHYQRALSSRSDLPPSHEFVVLGWIVNASELSGDAARTASYRMRRDELQLDRFREFTRFHYQRVVDAVRARGIPVIAMQYPLLPVESLRKLLDYREDVSYLENRVDFEAAVHDFGFRGIFTDRFAGSFGHLTERGNELVAENVAEAVAKVLAEHQEPLPQTPVPRP